MKRVSQIVLGCLAAAVIAVTSGTGDAGLQPVNENAAEELVGGGCWNYLLSSNGCGDVAKYYPNGDPHTYCSTTSDADWDPFGVDGHTEAIYCMECGNTCGWYDNLLSGCAGY